MTESFCVQANGKKYEIEISYTETDFSKNPALQNLGVHTDRIVPFLVMFNHGTVYVDKRAPLWYKQLAALHEMICCGKQYGELLDDDTDDAGRCSRVEKLILENAGCNRDTYVRFRTRMFDFIVQHNLVATDFVESAVRTRDMLALCQ